MLQVVVIVRAASVYCEDDFRMEGMVGDSEDDASVSEDREDWDEKDSAGGRGSRVLVDDMADERDELNVEVEEEEDVRG